MRNSIKAVVFGALSVIFSTGSLATMHQHDEMNIANDSQSEQIIHATGEVKDIDLNSKKVTISHEAIPAIGWPAMTMRFTFTEGDTSFSNLKSGSHVSFSFVQQGNISLLKSIELIQP